MGKNYMEEKRGIKINFTGIVSILTLIVMGIGTTFAYFSASVNGKFENVSVSSVEIILNLTIAPLYNGKPILPTNDEDIEKAFDNKCVDSKGSGACIAYTIELENSGFEQEGIATFFATSDSITNLKYIILDNENDYAILKGPTNAMEVDTELAGVPIKLEAEGDKKLLTIVIWLSNLNEPQDEEQGASFTGQVSFQSTMGAKITGTMNENVILQKN